MKHSKYLDQHDTKCTVFSLNFWVKYYFYNFLKLADRCAYEDFVSKTFIKISNHFVWTDCHWTDWVINSVFCKMTKVNRVASNKQKLDMVLLCIPSQFRLVKFGWELSGLVWFGLLWLSLFWYRLVWFGMYEFGLVFTNLLETDWTPPTIL